MFHDKKKTIAGILGVISAIVSAYVSFWPLALLAFAGLLVLLTKTHGARKGFFIGYIFGFFFMGGTLVWVFNVFPLSSIGINSYTLSVFLITFIWFITSSVLALALGLFGYCTVRFKTNTWMDFLLIPSLWVLFEIVRSWLFFILTIAPQSLIGPHWTFGYSGYVLSGSPVLLQFASLGGVYLLGFIFALLGTSIAHYYKLKPFLLFAFVVMLLLYIPVGTPRHSNATFKRITALKTTDSSYFSTENINREKRLKQIAALIAQAPKDTDIIAIPEDSRFLKLYPRSLLYKLPLSPTTYILGSSRFNVPGKPAQSRIMTYSFDSGIQKQYTKMLLVPEGEYLSLFYQKLFTLIGMGKDVNKFRAYKEYERGNKITPTRLGTTLVAVSLCSEVYSPIIQRKLSENAGVIIILSSQSRFKSSKILYNQIIAMSKVRAVENNRYLVQAFNFDNAFFISNTGEMVASTNGQSRFGLVTYNTPLIYKRSLFSLYPQAIPVLSLLITIFVLLLHAFDKKKKAD